MVDNWILNISVFVESNTTDPSVYNVVSIVIMNNIVRNTTVDYTLNINKSLFLEQYSALNEVKIFGYHWRKVQNLKK